MGSKLNVIERFIGLIGSIVSIIGFAGVSAYALIKNFTELAPQIGENLLLSCGAFVITFIVGGVVMGIIRIILGLVVDGFRITQDGEDMSLFRYLMPIVYVVILFIMALCFIGLLLLVWTR